MEKKRIKWNKELFIEKAREVHGDKYDYSKVEFKRLKDKVCIICPKHGEFWQVGTSHIAGYECYKCGKEKMAKTQSFTLDEWIKKARNVHGDKYDYSKVEYKGSFEKVCIICPEHGEFWQASYSHLLGHGCPQCMSEKNCELILSNTEEFIEKAKKVHWHENNDYSQVDYKGARIPVTITCEHGHTYQQMPNKHLNGHGCPMCCKNVSKPEMEIIKLITDNTNYEVVQSNRQILGGGFELDIYLPELKLAIEFDGLRWHSTEFKENKNHHLFKTEKCKVNGIRLIHIFEDEWKYKREIVESRLLNLLGASKNKVYARQCVVKEIDSKTSSEFMDTNHIQGNVNASVRLGLYHDDELVSVMTFCGLRKNLGQEAKEGEYELLRFCNKLNTSVPGSAGKLFKHFVEKYKPNRVISYADRRWSDGKLYDKLGFTLYNISEPNYFYVMGQQRYNRFQFRKSELIKEGFDPNKSEREIMEERGIHRIYDCGCLCYEIKFDNNGKENVD